MKKDGLEEAISWFVLRRSREDAAKAIRLWISQNLPKELDSPKGKGCKCYASYYGECGCKADWEDNDRWNDCLAQVKERLL